MFTIQMTVRARGAQPKLGLVFRGKGQRLSEDERLAVPDNVEVYWQKKGWVDGKITEEYLDRLALDPAVDTTQVNLLFMVRFFFVCVCVYFLSAQLHLTLILTLLVDNLNAQDNFSGQSSDALRQHAWTHNFIVCLYPPGLTDALQVVDHSPGQMVKNKYARHFQDHWALEVERSQAPGLTREEIHNILCPRASPKRLVVMRLMGRAWADLCAIDAEHATAQRDDGDVLGLTTASFAFIKPFVYTGTMLGAEGMDKSKIKLRDYDGPLDPDKYRHEPAPPSWYRHEDEIIIQDGDSGGADVDARDDGHDLVVGDVAAEAIVAVAHADDDLSVEEGAAAAKARRDAALEETAAADAEEGEADVDIIVLPEDESDDDSDVAAESVYIGDDDVFEVEAIVAEGVNPDGEARYLIRWQGYAEETWEPLENILNQQVLDEWERRKTRPRQRVRGAGERCRDDDDEDEGDNNTQHGQRKRPKRQTQGQLPKRLQGGVTLID